MKHILVLMLAFPWQLAANSCATTATGSNWSSTTHWTSCGGGVPGNGDTANVAHATTVDVSSTVGTSPASGGTPALVTSAAITIAAGVTFTIRGPVTSGNNSWTVGAGAIIEFDASQATTPLSQTYAFKSDGFSRGNRMFTTNGTSGSHVTIRSNASGGNGYFFHSVSNSDSWFVNLTYTDFQRIGDTTNNAMQFNASSDTTIQTMSFVTWDTGCGRVFFSNAPPAGGGWDFEDVKWFQTNPITVSGNKVSLQLASNTNNPVTGTRKVYRNVFYPGTPCLVGSSTADYQDNYFHHGICAAGQNGGQWLKQYGAFFRRGSEATSVQSLPGPLTTSFLLADTDAGVDSSGTVTSATATTLTDSLQTWTSGGYNDGAASKIWFVDITAGMGAGQRRMIVSNTSTQLVVAYRWDVNPDVTSTYAIQQEILNLHFVKPDDGTSGSTSTHSYDTLVMQYTGTDTQGDCMIFQSAHPMNISNSIWLPNGMGDCSCNMFGSIGAADTGVVTLNHNTVFAGAQALASISEIGGEPANTITSIKSNIVWSIPSRTAGVKGTDGYYTNGGSGGPYIVSSAYLNTHSCSDTTDIVSAGGADYNAGYGLKTLDSFCPQAANAKGYNYKIGATQPGANDVTGVDPLFADTDRSFWKWATTAPCSSTAVSMAGKISDGLACIRTDPTRTRTSLIPYIQAGFAPTSTAMHLTAHDGTDIGAVPWVPKRSASRIVIW